MTCEEVIQNLYVQMNLKPGEKLPAEVRREVGEHLNACEACRALVENDATDLKHPTSPLAV